jgi:hypothetical protein
MLSVSPLNTELICVGILASNETTWQSSICVWMGNQWDVLTYLWTKTEGQSDLVLSAKVREFNGKYIVDVYMVYVP